MTLREKGDDIFLTQSSFQQDKNKDEDDDFQYRFGKPLTSDELQKNIEICVPPATRYRNDWGLGVFKRWHDERRTRSIADNFEMPSSCLFQDILEMDPQNINIALKYFAFEARKKDGTNYPSNSLYGLFSALQSSLNAKGGNVNIFEDDEFKEARTSLDASMKHLSKCGLGASSRKKTDVISNEEEERLWERGSLGEDNPAQLLDTVLYLTGNGFIIFLFFNSFSVAL